LSGIHPELRWDSAADKVDGNGYGKGHSCVRPFLAVPRVHIEAYLRAIDQPWRQDESNDSLAHTRNRIRHELLPKLREFNPKIHSMLAHMADNARAEEQHWQAELDRVLPMLLLPGRPTRGGGRSVSTALGSAELAIEIARLKELDSALLRRVLRAAAERAGATLDFDATDRLLAMVMSNAVDSGKRMRLELAGGVSVNRSARELRFGRSPANVVSRTPTYELPIPGSVDAPAFHARFIATFSGEVLQRVSATPPQCAQIRVWQPGDKIELQHSRGPKKVKEILSRMQIPAEDRAAWPVVTWQGHIIWMRGVRLANVQNLDTPVDAARGGVWPVPVITEIRN
jgi:tRNA(Ile)-lysidine synthase